MTIAGSTTAVREDGHSARETIRTWVLIALAAFLLSLVAYAGFTTVGGIWFTISDALGLLLAGSMIPVITGFDTLMRSTTGGISRTAKWIGIAVMGTAGVGSIVLFTSEVSHEFVPAGGGLGMQFVGFGLEGVWFLLLGLMTSRSRAFSSRFVWTARAAGLGFVVGTLGAPLGPENPLVIAGATLSFLSFILWGLSARSELATVQGG